MKRLPRVAVLMATYNGIHYIEDQILSILNQNSCKVFLFISDNNSDDQTRKLLENLKKKNKNIEIFDFSKKNSFALNFYNLFLKINLKKFDFVALSDQDDIFIKNKFLKSINFLNKYHAKGMSSKVKCFGNNNQELIQSINQTKYDFLFEGAGQGCSFVIKSDCFIQFQDFCKEHYDLISNFYYHDWLIYIYFRSMKFNWIFYNDEALTLYRIHSNNNSGNKYSFHGLFKRLHKVLNGWYFTQIILANKISRKLDSKIPNLLNLSIFNLILLLFVNGRRKISDRIISSIAIIFFILIKKK